MEAVFLNLLNRSITAGWLILAVLVLRVILKKAPKAIRCVLWALVGIRLICPFSFESVLSLIPNAETISQEILYTQEPVIQSGSSTLNRVVNPVISKGFTSNAGDSVNPLQTITYIASVIWLAGLFVMIIYAVVSYLRIHAKVAASMRLTSNLFLCDYIDTPFILGILRPAIYLPSALDKEKAAYVIAHERAHLKRRDHWWKPLGFVLLSVYWFNPVIWVAYILLCRDIELACDERVIKELGESDKKGYADALLFCSVSRKMIGACPLAFGEVGVKERVKAVLNYKKPTFWMLVTAVAACIIAAACFLTNPKEEEQGEKEVFISNKDIGSENLDEAENGNADEVVGIGATEDMEVAEDASVAESIGETEHTELLETAIHDAILEHCTSGSPAGLLHCESHIIFDIEENSVTGNSITENRDKEITVYAMVLHQSYNTYGGELVEEGGSHIPTALTFSVDEKGEYALKEYWQPREGSYYVSDIREKFPEEAAQKAMDTQAYVEQQIQECHEQAENYLSTGKSIDAEIAELLDTIVSSPETYMSSSPGDYIESCQDEYDKLVEYGEFTLNYCFGQFLLGEQTDLRGHIMKSACEDIMDSLGEPRLEDGVFATGQDWFDAFRANAEGLEVQYTQEALEKNYPVSWQLIQILQRLRK